MGLLRAPQARENELAATMETELTAILSVVFVVLQVACELDRSGMDPQFDGRARSFVAAVLFADASGFTASTPEHPTPSSSLPLYPPPPPWPHNTCGARSFSHA